MNGKSLYWDNLAGTENVDVSILAEYGVVGLNDQTRVLDVAARKWTEPTPVDGGARSKAKIEPIVPGDILRSTEEENDGSLFCADGNFLADGRFLATGGTKYVNDPGNDISKFGVDRAAGDREHPHLRPRHQPLDPGGIDAPRALVPVGHHARRTAGSSWSPACAGS